jgi:hypothetical protein
MEGEEIRQLPLARLSLLALGLGVITGIGAVLFRDLIGLIHNLFFTGHAFIHYDANVFTAPAPWGLGVVLVPVLGAIGVTFLVTHFAPEAKGHGVPEVMDAIYHKGGVIRPVVALVKSLASALAIGSGSSVGREGPIIQIGSALGFHCRTDHSHACGPANRSCGCGRGRRYRRHLQYTDWRRDVCDRADDAGGERGDVSASRHCHRNCDIRGSLVFRRHAGISRTAASSHGG